MPSGTERCRRSRSRRAEVPGCRLVPSWRFYSEECAPVEQTRSEGFMRGAGTSPRNESFGWRLSRIRSGPRRLPFSSSQPGPPLPPSRLRIFYALSRSFDHPSLGDAVSVSGLRPRGPARDMAARVRPRSSRVRRGPRSSASSSKGAGPSTTSPPIRSKRRSSSSTQRKARA